LTRFALNSYTHDPVYHPSQPRISKAPTMSEPHFTHEPDEVQLAKLLRGYRPFLEQYGTAIIYGTALLLAVAAIFVYVARRPPETAAESAKLLKAETPEEFADIADNSPDTTIGRIASLREAELILQNALRSLFTNRKVGIEELDQAEKIYRNLDDTRALDADGQLKIVVGLARIAEARCNGDDATVKTAIDAWDRVLKDFPNSKVFSNLAEDRKKKLALPSTKDFYAWFQQQNPAPGDTLGMPQDGPGAGLNPAGLGPLDLPGLTPSTPVPATPEPPADKPAETPADPAAPAPDAPKTDPPAPDAPKTDAPAPDAPKADAPAPDAPKADAPAPDAPKADGPAPDAPKADAPAPDAPKADAPAPDAPKADAPAPDAPKADAPAPKAGE
jgi:hypothetical protein